MVAEAFLENLLVVIAPANHPLAKVKNIPPTKLANEPFLLREVGSELAWQWNGFSKISASRSTCAWSSAAMKRSSNP